jgi:Flp pilus assembly protein TadG
MKNRQSGHAMIELAASAAVMVTCIAGTFQFGYTFYVYNQLVTAVGNGARYAATRPYNPADADKTNQSIRNLVVFGDPQPALEAQPVVAGLTPQNVNIDWTMESNAPSAVSISIHEFALDAVFAKFVFNGRPGVEFPYVGGAPPATAENKANK